jgi:hypothetical protein
LKTVNEKCALDNILLTNQSAVMLDVKDALKTEAGN